jgi:hypothetical protein
MPFPISELSSSTGPYSTSRRPATPEGPDVVLQIRHGDRQALDLLNRLFDAGGRPLDLLPQRLQLIVQRTARGGRLGAPLWRRSYAAGSATRRSGRRPRGGASVSSRLDSPSFGVARGRAPIRRPAIGPAPSHQPPIVGQGRLRHHPSFDPTAPPPEATLHPAARRLAAL